MLHVPSHMVKQAVEEPQFVLQPCLSSPITMKVHESGTLKLSDVWSHIEEEKRHVIGMFIGVFGR